MARAFRTALCVLTTIVLAVVLFASGFCLCAYLPYTTRALSSATSDFADSPYRTDDLVELAVKTRDYTVCMRPDTDAGIRSAQEELCASILERACTSSEENSPTADRWNERAKRVLDTASAEDARGVAGTAQTTDTKDVVESVTVRLYRAGEQYALDASALSHLDDVNRLVANLIMPLLILFVCAIAGCVILFRAKERRTFAKVLCFAGGIVLGVFLLLGVSAVISFDALFQAMHTLFFTNGSWLFPAHSLLIEMYPPAFWVGMGAIWLICSCLLSGIALGWGAFLLKRSPKKS